MHVILHPTKNPISIRRATLPGGDVILVLDRYTLGLESRMVSTSFKQKREGIFELTMWLTLYTPTNLEASSNMLLRNEMTMNWAFLVRSLM
jgi:hypothetical protein